MKIFTIFSICAWMLVAHWCPGQSVASADVLNTYLQNYHRFAYNFKIYVHSDKYLYEHDEDIWFSALLVDRFTHKPIERDENILVTLSNAAGERVWTHTLRAVKGIVRGHIYLHDMYPEGKYFLKAYHTGFSKALFSKELVIRKSAIPYHLARVQLKNKYYRKGDTLNALLAATDYFQEPLKGANYQWLLKSGEGWQAEGKGKFDKDGKSGLSLVLPDEFSEDGLDLLVTLTYRKVPERLHIHIPVPSEKLHVQFFPEGGSLVAGIPNTLVIKAYDAYGNDFPFLGRIIDEEGRELGQVESDESGLSSVDIIPSIRGKHKLQITYPYPVSRTFDFPAPKQDGKSLSISHEDEEALVVRVVHKPQDTRKCYLAVINQGVAISLSAVDLRQSSEVKIAKSVLGEGVNRITLFDESMTPEGEVLFYKTAESNTNHSVSISSPYYDNREKVDLEISGEDAFTYAFSMVDEFRMHNEGHTPNIQSHLGVSSELDGAPVVCLDEQVYFETPAHVLPYARSLDEWKDIYETNDIRIPKPEKPEMPVFKSDMGDLTYQYHTDENLVFANYSQDVYYLASNPIFRNKLLEAMKHEKEEPFYKEQLRSGVPLRDVIYNMRQYQVMGGDKIVFQGSVNSLMFQGGALIVQDGVRLGESIGLLDFFNPNDIDEIIISTKPEEILNYTGLNSVGVIHIKTKRGENTEGETGDGAEKEFESPDYSKGSEDNEKKTDLRTTIYYKPFVKADSLPSGFHFYHSDIRSKFRGRVEGVDSAGNVVYREIDYASFNYSKENQ